MEPSQDPDDLVFVLDECRQLLEGMGQAICDERYKNMTSHAPLPEHEMVELTGHEKGTSDRITPGT